MYGRMAIDTILTSANGVAAVRVATNICRARIE